MPRTAIIVTSYNRPMLLSDCLASVIDQTDPDWNCYVMDDGSNEETVKVIQRYRSLAPQRFKVCLGPRATPDERKQSLRYSRMINVALREILTSGDERFICAVCDDDYLYPESVLERANFLDIHPEVHVCYGRLRAITPYGDWTRPHPASVLLGRSYPRPPRAGACRTPGRVSGWHYPAMLDPATGAPVEEGHWEDGPLDFLRYHVDHNQVMWRRECLTHCRAWPEAMVHGQPLTQFWREELPRPGEAYGVGDAWFFLNLHECHPFHPVDAWVATKRYHQHSEGRVEQHPTVREL